MICPVCKKNTYIVSKPNGVYCGRCDALLEGRTPQGPATLKCPKCQEYSRNDYCSHCGYSFKKNIDY
jgi:hypothetical protein